MDDFLKIGMGFDYKAVEDGIKKVNSLLGKGFNDVFININTKNIDKEIASIDTKLQALNKSREVLLKIKNPSANEIKLLADLENRIGELTTEKQINLSIKTAATTSLKDIKKQVEELTAKRNEIQLGLASEDLSKKLDEVNEKVKEITDKKAKVKLELEEANFSKQIKDVDKTIKLLEKKQLALKFDPDNSPKELQKQFESFTKEIDKLKTKKVSIELEATNAQKKIDFFDKKLKALDDEKITLSADTDKASKELDEIDKQLDNLEQVKKIKLQIDEKNLTTIHNSLNSIGKIGAAAIASVGAAAVGASVGLFKLADLASDAEESTNKLFQVFSGLETTQVQKSIDELTNSYGLSALKAKQALGATGDLFVGMGTAEDKALELSTSIQKLAVDLSSFQNLDFSQATEALTALALGERERAKSLGVIINEEMINNELRARGMEELTGLARQQAVAEISLQLALEQSSKAIGDYARTSGDFANQSRQTISLLQDLGIALGSLILPYLKEITFEFNEAIKKVTSFVSNNEKLEEAFKTLTTTITDFLDEGLDKLLENLPSIVNGFSTFVDVMAFLATNLNVIIPIMSGLAAAIITVNVATWAFSAGLTAVNVASGGLLLAVGAIVAGLVLLIMNFDKVKAVAISVFEKIATVAKVAVDSIVEVFSNIKDLIVEQFDGLIDFFVTLFDNVKDVFFEFVDFVKNIFVGIADSVATPINNIKDFFINAFESIKDVVGPIIEYIKSLFGDFEYTVGAIFANLVYLASVAGLGIQTAFLLYIKLIKAGFLTITDFLADNLLGAVSTVTSAIDKLLGDKSPFKGITESIDSAKNSLNAFAKASRDDLAATVSNFKTKESEYKNDLKTKLALLREEEAERKKVNASIVANEKKAQKEIDKAKKDSVTSGTTSGVSTDNTEIIKSNKERVDSLEETLNKELVLEKQALEVKKQLIANEVADEIEKNKQIEEAEEASQERRRALLEKSLFEYSASGGDIETLQITQEASITGDATTATKEYKALGGEIEAVTEKTATLADYMRSAFGGSMFDGLDSQIQNAIKSFDGLATKAKDSVAKFATDVASITMNTASYVSDLWGAITDLQNTQLEQQLSNLEDTYDSETEALENKYNTESDLLDEKYASDQEKLDNDYALQNEKLEEQLEKQDEINNEHQEMLDELQAERDELEAEKQAIMDEEDYLALQQKIKDKEAQIAAEKKALQDGEKTHANLLAKQEADEAAYNASVAAMETQYNTDKAAADLAYETQKYELERQYAIKKAELERKQAENTKALNIFNATLALAQGIAQAVVAGFASGLPLVFVPIYTAMAAALGGVQLATAIATPLPPIPAYADGGVVSSAYAGNYGAYGLTPPNSKDNTLAWVGTNERVLTETQNRTYESMMNSNNSNSTVNNYYVDVNVSKTNASVKDITKSVVKSLAGKT